MKRSGTLDSGISCTSDIEEQPMVGYNSGTDDSDGKCASATHCNLPALHRSLHHHSLLQVDQRTSLLCSLFADVSPSDARDHGGEYDEDVDGVLNTNQCGPKGIHRMLSIDGKLPSGIAGRKSSGIAGRSGSCQINHRQGDEGKANGSGRTAKRSEHRKVRVSSCQSDVSFPSARPCFTLLLSRLKEQASNGSSSSSLAQWAKVACRQKLLRPIPR